MGLRDKAVKYRDIPIYDKIKNFEVYFEGKVLNRQDLIEIKSEFNRGLSEVKEKLERKLIDIQTLFEIGRELNSTLNVSELIQILVFTLMGQFRLSEIAIFILTDKTFILSDQKGLEDIGSFNASPDLIQYLIVNDGVINLSEALPYINNLSISGNPKITKLVPLKNNDKLVGLIIIGNKPENLAYTDEELQFFFTLASLAGVALDNAGLYGELKNAYTRLDKKLSELSTLYEISKVINSSDDPQVVLSLIMETITTGFGVKKALLFTQEDGKYVVRKVAGLDEAIINCSVNLSGREESIFNNNKPGVIEFIVKFDDYKNGDMELSGGYILIPLISLDKQVGGIIIFSIDNYAINMNNNELLDLFSIISSQISHPIRISQMIQDQKSRFQDTFHPVLSLMENHISKAETFGVGVTFAMLKLKNFSKYIQFYSGNTAYQKLDNFNETLLKELPLTSTVIRYTAGSILIILPAIAESDLDDIKNRIYQAARNEFDNDRQINVEADILTASYPDDGEDKMSLLNMIE